jgi:hypothetical protein
MPTLITQEEGPPDILPTSNLTMAILPNVAKKKFVQRSFYFGRMTQPMMAAPPQETKQVLIREHMRGSSQIPEHTRIVKVPSDGNKKDNTKTKNSKKKKQTPKHSAFACMKEDDPRSIKLAKQFDVEQRLEFIKSFKK